MSLQLTSRKATWGERIANIIEEHRTFDLSEDEEGYPTIHFLIARKMLADYPEYEVFKWLDTYVSKVKNNLPHAIVKLEERGIPVYQLTNGMIRGDENNKSIYVLTIDPDYRDAKEKFFIRVRDQACKVFDAKINKLKKTNPDELEALDNAEISKGQLLLGSNNGPVAD